MEQRAETRTERVDRRKTFQDANVFSRISAAAMASRTQAQRILRQGGVSSIVEWRVLWDLAEAGPLTVNDMAKIQRLDHSLFSRELARMRQQGLVTAERDETDKRQMLFSLTKKGQATFDRTAPLMQERRRSLRAAFPSEDRATLLRLIDLFEAFLAEPLDLPQPHAEPAK